MATVLLVGGDLNDRARVERAATTAGAELHTAAPGAIAPALRAARPETVVLDLDGGGRAVLDELAAVRPHSLVPARVVGYYSHVDDTLGAAARAAGVDAIPRGRFWQSVGDILSS